MSMTDVLGDAGGPVTVKLKGKDWKIGHPTQLAKKLLEDLILERAEARVLARRDGSPEAYRLLWDSHEKAFQAGEYSTVTGARWQAEVGGPDGLALVLTTLLRQHHPEAGVEHAYGLFLAEPDAVKLAVSRVLPPFFESVVDGFLKGERFRHAPDHVKADAKARVAEMAGAMLATLSPSSA